MNSLRIYHTASKGTLDGAKNGRKRSNSRLQEQTPSTRRRRTDATATAPLRRQRRRTRLQIVATIQTNGTQRIYTFNADDLKACPRACCDAVAFRAFEAYLICLVVMPESFGKAIPPVLPHNPPKRELAWRKCLEIHKITENGKVTYDFRFEQQSNGGDSRIDECVRAHLNELVKQLPE